jgi:hypothetical protein
MSHDTHLEREATFLDRNLVVHALLGLLGLENRLHRVLRAPAHGRSNEREHPFDDLLLGLMVTLSHSRESLDTALEALPGAPVRQRVHAASEMESPLR